MQKPPALCLSAERGRHVPQYLGQPVPLVGRLLGGARGRYARLLRPRTKNNAPTSTAAMTKSTT